MRSTGLAANDIGTGIDPMAQQVVATATAAGAKARSSIRSDLARRTNMDLVNLSFTDEPVVRKYTRYGGALLRVNTANACTTGFSVMKGNINGIATAGRCPLTMNKYKDWNTGVLHDATYKLGFVGNWGDFAWLTTTGVESDDFYFSNAGAKKDVSGVKNSFGIGDPVAAYGRGGPHQISGTIKFLNQNAGGIGKLVCMGFDPGILGDSGGPYYQGSLAAGFVSVGYWINGTKRLCFAQARYIDDAIGASIKTN